MDPRDRKQRALARDCRNVYGNNAKAARKGIRWHKQRVNRTFRWRSRRALAVARIDSESIEHGGDVIVRPHWKKVPDRPLGEYLASKIWSRILGRVWVACRYNGRFLEVLEVELTAHLTPHMLGTTMRQIRHASRCPPWNTISTDFATARIVTRALDRLGVTPPP